MCLLCRHKYKQLEFKKEGNASLKMALEDVTAELAETAVFIEDFERRCPATSAAHRAHGHRVVHIVQPTQLSEQQPEKSAVSGTSQDSREPLLQPAKLQRGESRMGLKPALKHSIDIPQPSP